MKITLTSHLTADQMEPLWPGILACFKKYVERFKEDESIQNIMNDIVTGRRQLWVVQDDDGKVILAPVTEIVIMNATGHKKFVCAEVGGESLQDALFLLREMEAWAKEQGCEESELIGRKGWERLLAPHQYEYQASIYRKRI